MLLSLEASHFAAFVLLYLAIGGASPNARANDSRTPDSRATDFRATDMRANDARAAIHYVSSHSHATKKSAAKHARKSSPKRRRKQPTPRVQRVHRAFAASTQLRSMAQQLLLDRTPAGYAGVEAFARKHAADDAGALAWLVAGYAHVLDRDFAKAIDPLSRARTRAGELSDYVSYYLANSYQQLGRNAEAVAALDGFSHKYPGSLLKRDADLISANALIAEGRGAAAAALLAKDREPIRADRELALGRAYDAAGESDNAATVFRNLYFHLPLSSEATFAEQYLNRTGIVGSFAERSTRAELLSKGKRYVDAIREYKALMELASPADQPAIEIALGTALEHTGQSKELQRLLGTLSATSGEADAQRLYLLGESARSAADTEGVARNLEQLRQSHSTSPWLEQALLSAANMHLLARDFDQAIDLFSELRQRFPNGSRASLAHWKAAWLSFRQGRVEDAKRGFESHLALYPNSPEVSAALYWRGRVAEEAGDLTRAYAFYDKLATRFRNYYYADLARQRLKSLPAPATTGHYPALDQVAAINTSKVEDEPVPDDDLRGQKAKLLANGGLTDQAVRELQAAAAKPDGSWAPPEIARLYAEAGRYDRALDVIKRAAPNYFALDLADLPRSYWEALFPKPYWDPLQRNAAANDLDPYLVASLIRQESAFNSLAVSHANAIGLMQLLPGVGKQVARQVKLKPYNASRLFEPTTNLQLGTRYFRSMLDQYHNSPEYALAAYNAGSDRVDDWLAKGHFRDVPEFVESIPFTETREYVQAIVRNASMYRQLYEAPATAEAAHSSPLKSR